MTGITSDDLGSLHDSQVLTTTFDAASRDERSVVLQVIGHSDCEFIPWAGRKLRIIARDVAMTGCTIWGLVVGFETIDRVHEGVSSDLEAKLREARSYGFSKPVLMFTVALHSGSKYEIVCDRLEVEIQ